MVVFKGYAVMTIQKAPVNSLNTELLDSLTDSLKQLEKEKCNGLLVTSVTYFFYVELRFMLTNVSSKFKMLLGLSWCVLCWFGH